MPSLLPESESSFNAFGLLDQAEISVLFFGKWHGGSDWSIKKRKLEAWQLYAVLGGVAQFEVRGEIISAKKGDVILLPPREPYSATRVGQDNFDHLSLHFRTTLAGGLDLMPALGLELHQPGPFNEWISLLESDIVFFNKKEKGGHDGRLSVLLNWFLRKRCSQTTSQHLLNPSLKLILALYEVLEKTLAQPIELSKLAEQLSVAPKRLAKEVKQHTGLKPVELVRTFKIEKAKSFLLQGVSVTETASLTGFADIFYFSRVFRQMTGLSPKAFLSASELAQVEKDF